MKKLFKIILPAFILILCSMSFAQAENTGVTQLKSFMQGASSFEAVFSQSLFDEHGIELQFSGGKFSLLKPGKFSWDYEEPYMQVIMSNGKLIWMYDSELEQVTIKPVDESLSKTSMVLLFNKSDLDSDFNIVKLDVIRGVSWLELTAKSHDSEFSSILIGLKDNLIVSIKMIDGFGQTTVIDFTHINTQPDFKKDRFEFVIPKNADVIGGE